MRFILFWFLMCFSYFGQADDLLIPDKITTDTTETGHYVSSSPAKADPTFSAAEAAELVEKKFSGQVMSVTLQETSVSDSVVYGVKILKNGYMKTIYVDAYTGHFSKLSD